MARLALVKQVLLLLGVVCLISNGTFVGLVFSLVRFVVVGDKGRGGKARGGKGHSVAPLPVGPPMPLSRRLSWVS